jgi:hypothetical protein
LVHIGRIFGQDDLHRGRAPRNEVDLLQGAVDFRGVRFSLDLTKGQLRAREAHDGIRNKGKHTHGTRIRRTHGTRGTHGKYTGGTRFERHRITVETKENTHTAHTRHTYSAHMVDVVQSNNGKHTHGTHTEHAQGTGGKNGTRGTQAGAKARVVFREAQGYIRHKGIHSTHTHTVCVVAHIDMRGIHGTHGTQGKHGKMGTSDTRHNKTNTYWHWHTHHRHTHTKQAGRSELKSLPG